MNRKTLYSLGLLLLFAACKPCTDPTNPECENYCDDPANLECFNYDPCYGKNAVSAAFTIEEVIGGRGDSVYYIPTDTVIAGPNRVRFRAVQEAESYTWRIGNDTRVWNTRSVTLSFQNPTEVNVVLAVSSTPNTDCFPLDNGLDTVLKRLVVYPRPQTAMKGIYLMEVIQYPEAFPFVWEPFELRMTEFIEDTSLSPLSGYRIQGFTPGCLNDLPLSQWTERTGYRAVTFDQGDWRESPTCNFGPYGLIRLLSTNDSIEIRSVLIDKTLIFPQPNYKGLLIARGVRVQ